MTSAEHVYQIDTQEPDTSQQVLLLGYYRSISETGWPVGLGNMFLGPDCRIYVSPGSTTWYMHTIHSPDEKGTDCNFEERAIRTPTILAGYLPYFPNYHPASPCDSTINWGIISHTQEQVSTSKIHIYPNPAYEQITINTPSDQPIDILVYDLLGQLVYSQNRIRNTATIDVSTWHNGIYFYQALIDGKIIKPGKIEKVE